MQHAVITLLRGRGPVQLRAALHAALGAVLGIAFTGFATRFLAEGAMTRDALLVPLLLGPVGASAVLVFAIPASPLAQPRAVIGGTVVSALVGMACALLSPAPMIAAPLAVGLSIFIMACTGCLHPPGGAFALGAVLLATGGSALTYMYPLTAVLGAVVLVLAAMVYARFTGRVYPQRASAPKVHATRDPSPMERVGFTSADLDAALAGYGKLLDVSRDDLDALFRQVELKAHRRLHALIRCGEIMSRDVVAVDRLQPADKALDILHRHDLRVAPVVDGGRRVVGIVRRAELVAAGTLPVAQVLDPHVHKVGPGTPIETLLPKLSSGFTHEVMVVDEAGVLIGVVTQTDLLAVLYRAHIVESLAA